MIIDFHTHTFPEKIAGAAIHKLSEMADIYPFTDGTVSQLSASMKKAGVDRSVVLPVATAPRQVEHVNDASARMNDRQEETGLISFGCMHPDYENYREELARVKRLGMKGIKIHPVYQGLDIDDIRFLRIIERAAELGLIVVTHAGYDIGFPGVVHSSPAMCRHVVDEIGDFPFVLAHMGGWRNWEEVPEYLADTKVYLDTAFASGPLQVKEAEKWSWGTWKNAKTPTAQLNAAQFVSLIRAFNADRILFATDSPWEDQAQTLDFVKSLPLEPVELEKILGGNAVKLLR